MKKAAKLQFSFLIFTSLFLISVLSQIAVVNTCDSSSTSSSDVEIQLNSATTQPYLNNAKASWCRQASGNCGPTSFYMVFKYQQDNKKANLFYDDSTALSGSDDIRLDVTFLSATSSVNYWLDCPNPYYSGGLDKSVFLTKISTLKYDGNYYYTVTYSTTSVSASDTTTKGTQFSTIKTLLNNGNPVMLHLKRSSTSGHYIVIVGCDTKNTPETTDDVVYFLDPYLSKYEYDGRSITNNIPDDPLITVGYTAFLGTSWYKSASSTAYAYWDGVWFGFVPKTTTSNTTAPAKVTGLSASVLSSSSIKLSWTANSESDLARYYIYQNSVKVGESTTNSYTVTGLITSTTYSYQVSAVDTSSNEGTKSDSVSATTSSSADTNAPAQVTGLSASVLSSSSIKLTWTANSESDLARYYIYQNSVKVGESMTNSYTATGLTASTIYAYKVAAVDTTGNVGTQSIQISVTTSAATTPTMHVNSIDVTYKNRLNWLYYIIGYNIYTTVVVYDGTGAALSGVTVSISVTNPEGTVYTATGTTGSDGSVLDIKISASKVVGTYTVSVTSLSLSGYQYVSSSNVETSQTLTIS